MSFREDFYGEAQQPLTNMKVDGTKVEKVSAVQTAVLVVLEHNQER